MDDDVIPTLFNTYYYFIKSKISKQLKEEIVEFCLMYIEKYKEDVLDMLREVYPTLDIDRVYTDSLDHAEEIVEADIDKSLSKRKPQPPSVFPVSGMNMAPSGPAPAASGPAPAASGPAPAASGPTGPKPLKTSSKSAVRPKSSTQHPQAGDPRIFGPPGSDVGGSLKRLVKTSKKQLSLPYFDNHDDPYVFRNK
jgi:hypothetical protein